MPQREYSTDQSAVAKATKRITLPIELASYNGLAEDPDEFRHWLDEMIERYPELFPAEMGMGYTLHDRLPASRKLAGVRFRRIRLRATDETGETPVFTIVSSDVLPGLTGYTDEVEKALFLRRFGDHSGV